ncbi:MAG: hypothetical protein OXD45_01080 [Rhodobacteraceae bacterium]|nr:hypothetical protein [Paracoccaceae bacterium]
MTILPRREDFHHKVSDTAGQVQVLWTLSAGGGIPIPSWISICTAFRLSAFLTRR